MIDLRTGVPGSGKTLSAVEALAKMIARWEKHPEEARSIFVHGVKDLALPHSLLPMRLTSPGIVAGSKSYSTKVVGGVPSEVPDWELVPDGSYILIDECQSIFPPRASGSPMPDHVAFLNTHRHHGFDITLITQHPRLIDMSARALVGKHQHFRRLFGRQRAIVYEWDSCSDSLGGMANAVTSHYGFPKKAFEYYKSAEVHTKQNFKLPKWLLLPVLGVAAGVFAFPYAVSRISGLGNQDKVRASISAAGGVNAGPALPVGVAVASSSGVRVPLVSVVPPEPEYAGCLATPTKCGCFDADGAKVKVAEVVCRAHILGMSVPGSKADLSGIPTPPDHAQQAVDAEVLAFMLKSKKNSY